MPIRIPIVVAFDNRKLSGATKGLDQMGRAATVALAAVAAAAAGIAVASIREFAKFDGALQKSVSIMGDVADSMRDDMADAAREVAKTTTFSAEQAAESFFFLASAGLDAGESISALPRVAAFAQAGMFDMAQATDLLTDAQSALGLSVDDSSQNMENMTRVSDVLVKANTLANASVEQFSTSLTNKAGSALKALGKDIEEGVAVLAVFADQGIKAELAGNQLAIVLRDLTTKAIKNKGAFAELGIAVFDADGEMNNIADIIGDLEGALAGMSDETQKATLLQLGFTDKSVSAIVALLGQSEAMREYEASLKNAFGTTQDVADKQLQTFNSQLALLQSAFIDVALSIGQQMTPALGDLVETVKVVLPIIGDKLVTALETVDFAKVAEDVGDFVVAVVENIDVIAKVGEGLLVVAAALAIYRTTTLLAAAATALFNGTLLLNPIGLLITGLVGATYVAGKFLGKMDGATGSVEAYGDSLENSTDSVGNFMGAFAASAVVMQTNGAILYEFEDLNRKTSDATDELTEAVLRADSAKFTNLRNEALKTSGAFISLAREANQVASLTARYAPKTVDPAAEAAAELERIMGALNDTGNSTAATVDKVAQARQQLGTEIDGIVTSFKGLKVLGAVTSEFEKAVADTFSKVKDTIANALDAKVISTKTAKALNAIADTAKSIQMGIAKEREKLAVEYEQLVSRLNVAAQVRNSTAEAISAQADIAELGLVTRQVVNDLGDVSEESVLTSRTIVQGFERLLESTVKFQKQLITLRELGLDPTLFKQIVDSGIDAGGKTAQAIIEGGPEAVSEINNLFAELNDVGEQIGKTTSEVMFNGGESAIQGLIDGVIAKDAALVLAAQTTGSVLTSTLQAAIDGDPIDLKGILEALGSFESDFGDLGELLGLSFAEALQKAIDAAIASAKAALAAAMPSAPSGGNGGGGSSGSGNPGSVTAPTIADEVTEVVEEVAEAVKKAIAPLTDQQQAIKSGEKKGLLTNAGGLNTSSMSAAAMRGKDQAIINNYKIDVKADTRTGGAVAGAEIVKSLKQYNYNNGTIDLSFSSRRALK